MYVYISRLKDTSDRRYTTSWTVDESPSAKTSMSEPTWKSDSSRLPARRSLRKDASSTTSTMGRLCCNTQADVMQAVGSD